MYGFILAILFCIFLIYLSKKTKEKEQAKRRAELERMLKEKASQSAAKPTPAAPKPTPAAPKSTPAAPKPTPAAPKPTPAAPKSVTINGVRFSKDGTVLEEYPSSRTAEKYKVPSCVTTIGDSAFYGCKSLEEITLPDSVTTIGNYAFRGCKSLERIIASEANEHYCDIDGILFSKDKTKLIYCPCGKDVVEYTVPDTVVEIGYSAFNGCESLSEITLPSGVTTIGNSAFSGCKSLREITIPRGVKKIGIVEGPERGSSPYPTLVFLDDPNYIKEIHYGGTIEEWKQAHVCEWNPGASSDWKHHWHYNKDLTVHCTDGDLRLE